MTSCLKQSAKVLDITHKKCKNKTNGKTISAEASAVKEVRDQAIVVAVGAARDIIASQMTAADGNSLIDDAITQVGAKLH